MKSPKTKTLKGRALSRAKTKASAAAGTAKQKAPAALDIAKIVPADIKRTEKSMPLAHIAIVYNARTEFDEDWIRDELAPSIQQYGILERLWVYRLPKPLKTGESHGLIAGESRWRAAKLTTHLVAPVIDFDCSEKQAIELGLINNLQRKNLSVIDEAHAYQKMIDEMGYKAWDESDPAHSVGHRINGSKTHIYALLKLVDLPKLGQQAVQKNELSVSVAVRIARIPNAKSRKEALDDALHYRWTDDHAAEQISRRFMTELKGAPFDRKDPALNPERGACETCPYRSGNQAELYPEMAKGRADICTDPACYRFKCERSFEQRAEKHRAAGGKVLTPAEATQAGLREHYSQVGGAYADLNEHAYDLGAGNKTYRQVLAPALKDGSLLPALARANDSSGTHYELILKDDAVRIARKLGVSVPRQSSGGGEDAWQKKHREESARNKAHVLHWMGQISVSAGIWGALLPDDDELGRLAHLMRGTIRWLISNANTDAQRRVAVRRNLDRKDFVLKDESPHDWLERALLQLLDGCDTMAALCALQLELMAAPDWDPNDGGLPDKSKIVAEMLALKPAELERAAREAAQAAEQAKIDGVAPEGVAFLDWSALSEWGCKAVRKRFKDVSDKVHAKYAFAFGDHEKCVARRKKTAELIAGGDGEKPTVGAKLWEQLNKAEKDLAKKLLGTALCKDWAFTFSENGGVTQEPIGEEKQSAEDEEWELRVSMVRDDRRHGEMTVAHIAAEFGVSPEEAELISQAADAEPESQHDLFAGKPVPAKIGGRASVPTTRN